MVGVQNEICQSAAALAEMVPRLRAELDSAGFSSVKIHMANATNLNIGSDFCRVHQEAGVWPLIDYAAVNQYDLQGCFTDLDRSDSIFKNWRDASQGKAFLSTELCINNSHYQLPFYAVALCMGQIYHKNLVLADAQAICYCWLLLSLPQPSFAWSRTLCTVDNRNGFIPASTSHQLRVFGAYSRHVHRGMVRVEADSSDSDLLATAFVDDRSQLQTIVLLNRASTACEITLDGVEGPLPIVELVDQYHSNTQAPELQRMEGESLKVTVPPGALVTLSSVPLLQVPDGFTPP